MPPPATAAVLSGPSANGAVVGRRFAPRPLRPRSPGRFARRPSSPSEGCGCAACQAKAAAAGGLVFALGQVGYDLVSEARRDSIAQHMGGPGANPWDPAQVLGYLKDNPWEAASVIWTLNADQTPLYAIAPAGPFAGRAYELLRGVPRRAAPRRDRAGLDPRAAGRPGAAVQRPGRAGGGPRAAGGL